MPDKLEDLEARIESLRVEVRRAVLAADALGARRLRAELREAEDDWDEALAAAAPSVPQPVVSPGAGGALVPIREQVHQALTVLTVPSAPRLIVAVHSALFGGVLTSTQLTSLRRDEERSYRSSPHARPYYLSAALTADRLVSARGLVAVSTWPLVRRVVGPLSARVDFLTSAIRLSEHVSRLSTPSLPTLRLLWQFAANIPGAAASFDALRPDVVATAAAAELDVHWQADLAHREAAAERARTQLDETRQLFGSTLKVVRRNANDV
ncbi:hypothetical protein [Lentzea flaviverrucosa]|uniref:Uncharacterized protein n=1 Tax=Lentzea flaviverrucosa TaxID=200379 RepID=A0A1H9SJT4_9PSEU|nr:hypothetical protein [Lentzea flaviverrucosa]RDI25377.1 hypothetical protein DFR72_10869 [Lentzea flaviverrucosa]SER84509.1 hypothetical protein SAMN05216195_10770 [Lentzea flaviverrucosa]